MPRYARLPYLTPAMLDLDVYRGDTLSVRVQLFAHSQHVDIKDWEFEAQVRASVDDPEVLTDFVVDVFAPGVGGLRLVLPDDRTALLPVSSVWDLQSMDAYGRVRTLLRGSIGVIGDVTRPVVERGRRGAR